jgi:hypothetical protein
MKTSILLQKTMLLVGTLAIVLLFSTSITFSQDTPTTGYIIVDLWTWPGGNTYVFNFDASGGAYADFSLTDDAAPNDQELAPGSYSVTTTIPDGWSIHDGISPSCRSSLGYWEDPANLQLEAGETLNCSFLYEKDEIPMELSLNVETAWVQTAYNWNISKAVSPGSATVSAGETASFNYTVQLDQIVDDSDSRIFGTLSVFNPSPWVRTYTLTAVIGGSLNVEVLCYEDEFSDPTDIVQAEEANDCVFSVPVNAQDYEGQTMVVTVTTAGFPPFVTSTASDLVEWSNGPTMVTGYPVVDLIDNADEPFTDNSWNDVSADASFTYTQSYTCSNNPADYGEHSQFSVTFNNTVQVVQDTTVNASASATVTCLAPIVVEACTYGQGYWASHSEQGPAPYDEAWLNIGSSGAATSFFVSGMTYYELLSTPPAGNFYYQLARQYIAAKLNILNGASSMPEVDAAIEWAETQFFNLYSPSDLPKELRDQALAYASTLDAYNSGLIGPGACGE